MRQQSKPSPAVRLFGRFLQGAVESFARGAAKGLESIAQDAEKALRNEAAKARAAGMTVEAWRKQSLGEIEDLEEKEKEKKR
jgi:hypothetical protein